MADNTTAMPRATYSLRQAAAALGVNRDWLSGFVAARGIRIERVSNAACIRKKDLERIRRELATMQTNLRDTGAESDRPTPAA